MHDNQFQTLETRRKISRIAFLHNCFSGKIKLNLPDYVEPLKTRRTRHNHQHSFAPILAKINSYKYNFFPQTIEDWNSLPAQLFLFSNFITEVEKHFPF